MKVALNETKKLKQWSDPGYHKKILFCSSKLAIIWNFLIRYKIARNKMINIFLNILTFVNTLIICAVGLALTKLKLRKIGF